MQDARDASLQVRQLGQQTRQGCQRTGGACTGQPAGSAGADACQAACDRNKLPEGFEALHHAASWELEAAAALTSGQRLPLLHASSEQVEEYEATQHIPYIAALLPSCRTARLS